MKRVLVLLLVAGCLEVGPVGAPPDVAPEAAWTVMVESQRADGVFAGAFSMQVPASDAALLPTDKPARADFREQVREAMRGAMLDNALVHAYWGQLSDPHPAWHMIFQGPGDDIIAGGFCSRLFEVTDHVASGSWSSCTSKQRDACTGAGAMDGNGSRALAALARLDLVKHTTILWYHPGAAYVEIDCRAAPLWAWHAYAFSMEDLLDGQGMVTVATETPDGVVVEQRSGAVGIGHIQVAVGKQVSFGGLLADAESYPVWRTEIFDTPAEAGAIEVRLATTGLALDGQQAIVDPEATRHEVGFPPRLWISPAPAGTWWLEVQDHEQTDPFEYTIDATLY